MTKTETMMTIKEQAIYEVVNAWFKLNVIKGDKELKTTLDIKNEYLKVQASSLYSEMKVKPAFHSFLSDYILECYLAMTKMQKSDEFWREIEYQALIVGAFDEDIKPELEELSKYVYVTVSYEMKQGKTLSVNGEKAYINLNTISLDSVNSKEDGSKEVSIADILTSEEDIFSNYDNQAYYNNSFRIWFDDTRKDILTKNQNEFLNNVNLVNFELDAKERIKEILGVGSDKVNTKLDKIADRVVVAYNKQLPSLYSKQQTELSRKIELIEPIERIMNGYFLENQNQDIFEYVSENFEELQPFLKLSANECVALNRREYSTAIVYKVSEQLLAKLVKFRARLEELNDRAVEAVEKKEKFVYEKKNSERDEKIKTLKIVGRDGFMVEEYDEYDMPDAGEVRSYVLTK